MVEMFLCDPGPASCHHRVTTRNVYFENTPLSLLAGLVTEDGLLDPSGIPALIAARRHQYRTAFQLP